MQVRNLEDEKLRIWQESISKMVQNVENTINNSDQVIEDEDEEWKKDAMERGRLAELNLRIKQAEELMQIEEEENKEEGPVVALVKLSQKVRDLVRNMLVQANSK